MGVRELEHPIKGLTPGSRPDNLLAALRKVTGETHPMQFEERSFIQLLLGIHYVTSTRLSSGSPVINKTNKTHSRVREGETIDQ